MDQNQGKKKASVTFLVFAIERFSKVREFNQCVH